MTKLPARGRGRNYSRLRGVVEAVLGSAFVGDWPARLWARVPGATRVRVVRHQLAILPRGCPDLRLGLISDIHLGPTTPRQTVAAAFALLQREAPDVLLLAGDYVFLEASEAKARELGAWVASVAAEVKLAVMGNHDLWTRHELIEEELARQQVGVLINRAVRLPAPYDEVAIIGLDDPWTGSPDADRAFAGCDSAALKLVLCHAPEGLELVHGRGVALLLCGHTHGGQMALPWTPVIVQGHVGRRYPHGLFDVDGLQMFVSRGIGGIEIPMRTFAPPDVAIITLTSTPHNLG